MSDPRVILTLEPYPPRFGIRSATIRTSPPQPMLYGKPPSATEINETGKPLYLCAGLTPESRDEMIARNEYVVVSEFIGEGK